MNHVYSVGKINTYIKNMFSQDFLLRNLCVKGEASNVKYHSSGHIYFTMKDREGAIACVMFAGCRNGLGFRLQEGQQILTTGSIEVYERDGKYQLYAKTIVLEGAGLLYEKFEQLKLELKEMGMFDAEYKLPIPKYAMRIGVVTASTGAAIQDIINITKRRNPYVQLILYPAKVQGEGAAKSIAKGIRVLQNQNIDLMIVGRGGGSIEDLWAFNEEIVARAIFDSVVPIISAVGHETDTTIADYVADLRAPTPSAAAELAVFSYEDFKLWSFDCQTRFGRVFRDKLRFWSERIERYRMRLDYMSPMSQVREKQLLRDELSDRLTLLMNRVLDAKKHQLELYIERMNGLSPLEKLRQGLSYVEAGDGIPLRSIQETNVGETIRVQMNDGEIKACVEQIIPVRR